MSSLALCAESPNITMFTPGRVHTKQDDLWAKQLVSPLVERLQQRDAVVDDRIGVEEERLEEDGVRDCRPLETAPPVARTTVWRHAPARECTHSL